MEGDQGHHEGNPPMEGVEVEAGSQSSATNEVQRVTPHPDLILTPTKVLEDKGISQHFWFSPAVVYKMTDYWDYCDEEADYFAIEEDKHLLKINIPTFSDRHLLFDITLTLENGIRGKVQEVKDDPESPDLILVGQGKEEGQVIKYMELVHMHAWAPRCRFRFPLTNMTEDVEMIANYVIESCACDSERFFEEPCLGFYIDIEFTKPFNSFLQFGIGKNPNWSSFLRSKEDEMEISTKILYLDKKYSDFNIIVEGTVIPVHSQVLAGRSTVFAAMLNQVGLTENKTRELVISDFPLPTVKEMIAFLYLGKFESWKTYSNWGMMSHLLLIGDKYNLPSLMELASEAYMAQWLDDEDKFQTEPTLDWFQALCLLDSESILKKSAVFIQPMLKKLEKDDKWNELVRMNTKLDLELKAGEAPFLEMKKEKEIQRKIAREKFKKDHPDEPILNSFLQ